MGTGRFSRPLADRPGLADTVAVRAGIRFDRLAAHLFHPDVFFTESTS
jgi:hypothetical protein